MVEITTILAIFGVYGLILATFVVWIGLNVINKVFSPPTETDQSGKIITPRSRDLHKYPVQATEKIMNNLLDRFLKDQLHGSKNWNPDQEGEGKTGIGGILEQFGIDDIVEFAKEHPDEVKEFLSGLKPDEKGAKTLPAVKAML